MGAANCSCKSKQIERDEDGAMPTLVDAVPVVGKEMGFGEDPKLNQETHLENTSHEHVYNDENLVTNLVEEMAHIAEEEAEAAVCTLTQADNEVGDHLCPVVGEDRVDYFKEQDKLAKLLEASGEDLGRTFSLDGNAVSATEKGATGGFACAVSDPTATDCPLVYVSKGFEDLTGYSVEFATGRSCRFLQPTSRVLNDAINMEERKIMRDFCTEIHPVGTTIVNLLLNQRFTGERFWNLLRMQYVTVDGDIYIFAVQTNLDTYMPKALQKAVNGAVRNESIVKDLAGYIQALSRMRAELRRMVNTPMMELKGYFTASMNYLQMLPMISKAAPSLQKPIAALQDVDKEAASAFKVNEFVEVVEAIKYPSFALPPKSLGKIVSMDSFGNVVIEWHNSKIGTKGVLKRDFNRLQLASKASLNSIFEADKAMAA